MDIYALAAGAAIALLGLGIGSFMRLETHALLPFRDPVFIIGIMGSQMAVLFLAVLVPTPLLLQMTSDVPMLLAVMFDAGYLMGFFIFRPNDRIYVDLPREDGGCDAVPLVYYTVGGVQYMMPQKLRWTFLGLLGIRCPLEANIYEVSQVRTVYVSNGLISVSVPAAPACLHEWEHVDAARIRCGTKKTHQPGLLGEEVVVREPRYLMHFKVESHRIIFSQATLDDPMSFWRKRDLYLDAIANAAESAQHATRLEIQLTASAYNAAADLIGGMLQMTTDAPDYEADLRLAIAEERARRTIRRRDDDGGNTK